MKISYTLLIMIISMSFYIVGCTGAKKVNSENLVGTKSTSNKTISNFNQQELLKKINEVRSKGRNCGSKRMKSAAPLIWSDVLQNAAEIHSLDMSKNNYLSHTGKTNGSTLESRIKIVRYSFLVLAENIAFGYPSVDSVLESWLKSSMHCVNIMKPEVSELGVDVKNNYWTMVLAKPRSR